MRLLFVEKENFPIKYNKEEWWGQSRMTGGIMNRKADDGSVT